MEWSKLLSNDRNSPLHQSKERVRSPFLRDVDKVTFSPYFRALQDKTQVFPLSKNSYIRTRLTHSLEVATISRSLGFLVGDDIIKKYNLSNQVNKFDFSYILQAASLAHDIGNTPFGHQGETAIGNFYSELISNSQVCSNELSEQQKQSLINFDGNAQGFRILTNISSKNNHKGIGLTYTTLGAFCKYPSLEKNGKFISGSKIGIFDSEHEVFQDMVSHLGLNQLTQYTYCRHPLNFLLEAADDICYMVADLEDAFFAKIIAFNEVEQKLRHIVDSSNANKILLNPNYTSEMDKRYQNISNKMCKIEFLASEVINILIHVAAKMFLEYESQILCGSINTPLLNISHIGHIVNELKEFSKERIYSAEEKSKHEINGIFAIKTILKIFTNIALSNHSLPEYDMINNIYLNNQISQDNSLYCNFNLINDFVAISTDQNIIDIYKSISLIN